jgi:hypothetical protein
LLKRSFTKEQELACKKDFAYTSNFGKEFDEILKRSMSSKLDGKRSANSSSNAPIGNGTNSNFNSQNNINDHNLKGLSKLGKKIISSFVKDNEFREKLIKEKEEEMYKYKHSKPPVQLNSWKCSSHIIEEFSRPPGDKIHSFKKEKKKKFLNNNAFKVPKKEGEYFEKEVKLI